MTHTKIVHIDDNAMFRQAFRKLMSDKGFDITSYADSVEAHLAVNPIDLKVAIVDSSGLDFARKLRDTSPGCRTIVLSSSSPADSGVGDVVISKTGSWRTKVSECLERFSHEESIKRRQRLDLFADPQLRDKLRGKIAIVGGNPESVLAIFDRKEDAMNFLDKSTLACRIVQGPTLESLSLAELQGNL